MKAGFIWRKSAKEIFELKMYLKKKEGKENGIWKVWWTICATRIKGKIK